MNEQSGIVNEISDRSWLGHRVKPWIEALLSHRFGVAILLGSLLSISALAVAGQYWLEKREQEYFGKFEAITADVDIDQLVADEKKSAELVQKLSELVVQHPRSDAGALSSYYLGEIHFRQKKYTEAIQRYQEYLSHLPRKANYRALVLQSIGYAYEELNQNQQAANSFLEAATIEQAPLRDQAYMNAARAYEHSNAKKEARQYYQKVVDDFPESASVAMARAKLLQLQR